LHGALNSSETALFLNASLSCYLLVVDVGCHKNGLQHLTRKMHG
jgi:hypothetical protein